MRNFSLIITAGGTSSRYGNTNKLLEKINDKTVIEETVSKFIDFDEIDEIIISANSSIIEILQQLLNNPKVKIIEGGNTRQKSVYNALQVVKNDYVLIHDGARPLIRKDTIAYVLEAVLDKDAVTVMTKTTDTIKEVDSTGRIIRTIDRSKLYNTQTPQAFKTSIIKEAHEKLKDGNFTDDCSMLEELKIPVYIVNGSYTNIKITIKSDLDFAKLYI
ncbi:2-C-methyl-D-erythritol 4-phosphate cytidylyltransferase [bacterium]|nr:2-C-methyl-D-erythritol 4-phosphate cytidylyltransferase [bacterium]